MKEKCVNCGKEIGFFGKLVGLKKDDKYLCDNCYGKIKEVKNLCSFNEKNISMDNLLALLNFYPNLQPAFDEKNAIWQKYGKYITDIDKMISSLKANLEYANNLHKENLKEFARSMDDHLKNAKEWGWHELYGKTGDDAIYYISRLKKKGAAGTYKGIKGLLDMFADKCQAYDATSNVAYLAGKDFDLLMEIKEDIDNKIREINLRITWLQSAKSICDMSANVEWIWCKNNKLKSIFDELQGYITETEDNDNTPENGSKIIIQKDDIKNIIFLYSEILGLIEETDPKIPESVLNNAIDFQEELLHFTDLFSSEMNTNLIEAYLAETKAKYWELEWYEITNCIDEYSGEMGDAVIINRFLKCNDDNIYLAKVKILLYWNTILEDVRNPNPVLAKEPIVINRFKERKAAIKKKFDENQSIYKEYLLKFNALKPQIFNCFTFIDINSVIVKDKPDSDLDEEEITDIDFREDKEDENFMPTDDLDEKEKIPVENPVKEERRGIICKECGRENVENAKFCRYCGANMLPEIFCINCGKAIKPGKKFCSGCGAKVEY